MSLTGLPLASRVAAEIFGWDALFNGAPPPYLTRVSAQHLASAAAQRLGLTFRCVKQPTGTFNAGFSDPTFRPIAAATCNDEEEATWNVVLQVWWLLPSSLRGSRAAKALVDLAQIYRVQTYGTEIVLLDVATSSVVHHVIGATLGEAILAAFDDVNRTPPLKGTLMANAKGSPSEQFTGDGHGQPLLKSLPPDLLEITLDGRTLEEGLDYVRDGRRLTLDPSLKPGNILRVS